MTQDLQATVSFLWGPEAGAQRVAAEFERSGAVLCGRIAWSLRVLFGKEALEAFSAKRTIPFHPEGFVEDAARHACVKEALAELAKMHPQQLKSGVDEVALQVDGWSDAVMATPAEGPALAHEPLEGEVREWVYQDCGPVVKCYHFYGFQLNGQSIELNMPDDDTRYRVRLFVLLDYEMPLEGIIGRLPLDGA